MLVLPKGNDVHMILPSAVTQASMDKLSPAAVSLAPILFQGQQEIAVQVNELVSSSPLIALLLITNSDEWDGNTPLYSLFCQLCQDCTSQVLV